MQACASKNICINIPERFLGIVPYVLWICAGLVAFQIAQISMRLMKWIYVYYLRPAQDPKEFGTWAMVTGCTDGIGKEYALQLAKKGMNIVLVSRTKAKLEAMKAEVEKLGVAAEYLAIDLVKPTQANWDDLNSLFDRFEIGLVVNNAGMSVEYPEYMHQIDLEYVNAIAQINDISLVTICHMALNKMVKRRKGCIVNVGSTVCHLAAMPMLTVYVASKGFVRQLSKCLREEYKQYNIKITGHAPSFVTTKMSQISKPSFFIPTAAAFAAASIDKFGQDAYLVPYPAHAIQMNIYTSLPSWISNKYVRDAMLDERQKALEKKKRSQ